MHKCLKKGEVLKKRREARRQKKAAASLDIQNHCPSITFQDNEKDTEQPVLINLQAMSNTDMPGQESIVDCVQTLRPSLGGGGTYPREGKPRRGFLCPLNFLGAIPEGARKSLALFGILGVEARRTKIAS